MNSKSISTKIKHFIKKALRKVSYYSYFVCLNRGHNQSRDDLSSSLKSTVSIRKSNKKKMMILWPFMAIGGAENLVLDIIRSSEISSEFDFINVCLYEPSEYLGDLSNKFESLSYAFYKAENFQNPSYILDEITYLISAHKIEVLFIPNGTLFFYDSVQAIKTAFPYLRIVNQVYDHQEGWIKHYEYLHLQSVDYHIAPNFPIKQTYIEYGVPSNRAILIHHGIHLENFSRQNYLSVNIEEIKKSLQLPLDKIIITFAARMHSQKRPFDFLEIAKHFFDDPRFHFLIVGNGELSNQLEEEIQKKNLSNVTKLGFQKQIEKIYLITDIIVITSQYEALPLVLLGSQCMGVPAVSTAVGEISEVIKNGVNGMLISKIGDLNSFFSAINHITNNLKLFRNNCKQMQNDLSTKFSVEKMSKAYLAVFRGEP